MRNIIFFFVLLFTTILSAQLKVDALEFQGNVTTTIRDAYDVPVGKVYLIHNITTNSFQWAADDDVWIELDSGDNQNASEVSNTPSGLLVSTNVQDAINELGTTKINNSQNNVIPSAGFQIADTGSGGVSKINIDPTNDWIRLEGGTSGNSTTLIINDNGISTSDYTNAKVGANGSNIITRDYADANYNTGITPEIQNQIENAKLVDSYVKSADFLWSPSDVQVSSGTSTNGMKSIVTNRTNTTIEGEMEDSDVAENQTIVVRNVGSNSVTENYIVDGDVTVFESLDGTTGNQWTVSGSSQCTGTKEGNVITVGCGTVGTKAFITNLYTGAGSADGLNSTDSSMWNQGTLTVATNSNATHVRTGTQSLLFNDTGSASTAQNKIVVFTPTATVGQKINASFWFKADAGMDVSIRAQSPIGALTTLTGNGGWQQLVLPEIISDGGETRIYVYVNAPDATNGTDPQYDVYVDDVIFTITN